MHNKLISSNLNFPAVNDSNPNSTYTGTQFKGEINLVFIVCDGPLQQMMHST